MRPGIHAGSSDCWLNWVSKLAPTFGNEDDPKELGAGLLDSKSSCSLISSARWPR
jgi:hypothetical protein